MQETWVRVLGQEDPLDKEMATYSNILAWRIPWTEEPGRLQPMGVTKVRYDLATPQAKLEGKEYLQYITKFKNLWWRRKKTHSSVLAWEIPRTEEPGRLQSTGSQESDTTEHKNLGV